MAPPKMAPPSGEDPPSCATPAPKSKPCCEETPEKVEERSLQPIFARPADLALDREASGRWLLTHLVTGERVALGAGGWELIADDDGEESVLAHQDPAGEEKVVDPEDLLQQRLFLEKGSNEYWVKHREQASEPVSLTLEAVKHRLADASLRVAACGASFSFAVAVFRRRRGPGLQVFWSLPDLYAALDLKSFAQVSSRWIFRSHERWDKACVETIGCKGQHVVFSCSHADQAGEKNELPWKMRCLPFAAMGTASLVVLLNRWCHLPREQGGLSEPAPRAAAELVLKSILGLISEGQSNLRVVVALLPGRWECLWPRPPASVQYDDTCTLLFGDGTVDLSDLLQKAADGGCVAGAWAAHLFPTDAARKQPIVATIDFFGMCAKRGALQPLLGQVIVSIARVVEARFGGEVTKKATKAGVVVEWRDSSSDMDANEVDKFCAQYVCNSRELLGKTMVYSVATDAGWVNSLPLQNTLIGVPSGYLVLCPPQVGDEHDDEHAEEREMQTKKRELPQGSAEECRAKRHKTYLQNATSGSTPGSYRPKPVHRVSSKKWACMIDNQLQASTGHLGLSLFQPPERLDDEPSDSPWRSWRRWPYISVAMDLGSDGNCAYHSLERKYMLNIDQYNDASHGCNRDWALAVKSVGLWSFALVLLVSINLPHGPHRNDQRRHEIRSIMNGVYQTTEDPKNQPLFLAYAGSIIKALPRLGIELPKTEDPEVELWRYMRTRSFGVPDGRRVNLCRFMGLPHALQHRVPNWHIDLYERLFISLELDFMGSKTLRDKLFMLSGHSEAVGEKSDTTNSAKAGLDEKLIRSVAQNAVVVSVLLLQQESNKRIAEVLLVGSSLLVSWHTKQNRALRGAQAAHDFLHEQAASGFMSHAMSFVHSLCSATQLEQAEFCISRQQSMAIGEDVKTEDYFADVFAMFTVGLAGMRMRRHLQLMTGWPLSLVRLVGLAPEEAEPIVEQLRMDWDIYNEVKGLENPPDALTRLLHRHACRKTSVLQIVAGLQESAWVYSEKLDDLLRERTTGIFASQVCEDAIGYEKNNKAGLANRRFRRPLFSMHAALKSKIITERHDFMGLSMEVPLRTKSERLAPETFHGLPAQRSLPLKSIAGVRPSADWYSPALLNNNTPTADLYLLRACHELGDYTMATQIKANELFKLEHRFVFRYSDSADEDEYDMPLSFFLESAILVLGCRKRKFGDTNYSFFEFDDSPAPVLKCVFDMKSVLACPIRWRSVAWQHIIGGKHVDGTTMGVRAFAMETALPVFKLACKEAFWSLSRTTVAHLASLAGIAIDKSAGLFDTLYAAVKEGLNADDTTTLDYLGKRLAEGELSSRYDSSLLQIEEAVEVLERFDQKEIQEAQKAAVSTAEARSQFQREYSSKRVQVRDLLEQARAPAAGKERKKVLGQRAAFFSGPERNWNLFDAVILVISIASFVTAEEDYSIHIRILRLVRILRSAQVFRLIHMSESLQQMVDAATSVAVVLFWFVCLLCMGMYLVGVLMMEGIVGFLQRGLVADPNLAGAFSSFDRGYPVMDALQSHYGGAARTWMTLFRAISGGDWSALAAPIIAIGWEWGVLWLLYITLTCFGLLNIVIGIVVDIVHRRPVKVSWSTGKSEEETLTEAIMDEMLVQNPNLHKLPQRKAKLSHAAFSNIIMSNTLAVKLEELGIDRRGAADLYFLLDYKNQQGGVSPALAARGLLSLDRDAKAAHLAHMARQVYNLQKGLHKVLSELHSTQLYFRNHGTPDAERPPEALVRSV